jgi:SecD/SecF fusion protein
MSGIARWKLILVIGVFALAGYYLWPTYKYYRMPVAERAAAKDLQKKIIHMGLDLQGGMHVVLEADLSQVPPDQAKDALDRVVEILRNRVDQFGVSEPVI